MTPPRAFHALLLLACGCAQVREPSGGEKDTMPPQLDAAEPPSGTTGFAGDRITLRFNERIRLGGADKVLVSPPLAAKPAVRMSGSDAVTVELRAPLDPNTTYVFNIGDAVTDLTEGNPASGLLYVISTGDHIDSLHLQGEVLNANTAEPEKDVLVMLYDQANDTGFTLGRPSYYTRTLENGSYHLPYLRPGDYTLMALRDQNGNYRYDLPNEEVAFLPGLVSAHADDTLGHTLRLFREIAKEQALLSARVVPDAALRLVLARPAGTIALEALDWTGGGLRWTMDPNATGDTVLCWPSDTTLLEGRSFRVVENGVGLDTVQYLRREKMPYDIDIHLQRHQDMGGTRYTLQTSRPVRRIDAERVILATPSGVIAGPFLSIDTLHPRTLRLDLPPDLPPDASVTLLPKAVLDDHGGSQDTLRFQLREPAPDELGLLTINLERGSTAAPRSILQVLTTQDQVLRELAVDSSTVKVGPLSLLPGTYGLRLVDDANGNGRWDTGALSSLRPPELVRRQPGSITVRAGWDISSTWSLGQP